MEQINNITSHAEIMVTHIAVCKTSDINVRAYCLEHKLKPSNYYYWLAKSREPLSGGKFMFIPIPIAVFSVPLYIVFTNACVFF